MAKKTSFPMGTVEHDIDNENATVQVEQTDLPEEPAPLTAEQLLEEKLQRLELQKKLAGKRKSYITTKASIEEYLQELEEAEDNEEYYFESKELVIKLCEYRSEKLVINNPVVMKSFLNSALEQLTLRIAQVEAELLGN